MEVPDKIYLQTGSSENWGELDKGSITWSEDRVMGSDILYVNPTVILGYINKQLQELNTEIDITNGNTMAGSQRLHRLRGMKKELKKLATQIQSI